MKLLLNVIIIFFCSVNSVLGQPISDSNNNQSTYPMTGNLFFDSQFEKENSLTLDNEHWFFDQTKKPLKAAIYSAVVPGLGQLYNESYWSAAGFFAVEVILLGSSIYYENTANKKEDDFEKLANDPQKGWFVNKYATFLINYNQGTAAAEQLQSAMGNGFNTNGIPGNRSWWGKLNELERISTYSNGQTFSHVLPQYNTQQYYELIGKYDQFSPGWWDHNSSGLTPTSAFLSYRDLRAKANDIHNLASTLMIGVFINHIGSAVVAALQAHGMSKNIEVSFYREPSRYDKMVVSKLSITF